MRYTYNLLHIFFTENVWNPSSVIRDPNVTRCGIVKRRKVQWKVLSPNKSIKEAAAYYYYWQSFSLEHTTFPITNKFIYYFCVSQLSVNTCWDTFHSNECTLFNGTAFIPIIRNAIIRIPYSVFRILHTSYKELRTFRFQFNKDNDNNQIQIYGGIFVNSLAAICTCMMFIWFMNKIYAIFQFVPFQVFNTYSSCCEWVYLWLKAQFIISQSFGMCHHAFYSKIIYYYLAFSYLCFFNLCLIFVFIFS